MIFHITRAELIGDTHLWHVRVLGRQVVVKKYGVIHGETLTDRIRVLDGSTILADEPWQDGQSPSSVNITGVPIGKLVARAFAFNVLKYVSVKETP